MSLFANPVLLTVLLGALGGLAATLGAVAARLTHVDTPRHDFVTAFGAGALLGAVGLVLLPHAADSLPIWMMLGVFAGGGLVALLFSRVTARAQASKNATFAAMMLDFLPEALVVGALIPVDPMQAAIVTLIIMAQNGPEGFAAYSEMAEGDPKAGRKALLRLATLPLIGIAAVAFGVWLCELDDIMLGLIMAGASGGILYLVMAKIVPESHHPADGPWPAYGGVLGFGVALLGYALTVH